MVSKARQSPRQSNVARHRRRRSAFPGRAGLLLLLTLCACTEKPATQLLVRVRGTLHSDELQSVTTTTFWHGMPRGDGAASSERRYDDSRDKDLLPFSYGVAPGWAPLSAPVTIEVSTKFKNNVDETLTTKVKARFTRDRAVLVDLFLDRECVGMSCPGGCKCGKCLPEASNDLQVVDANEVRLNGHECAGDGDSGDADGGRLKDSGDASRSDCPADCDCARSLSVAWGHACAISRRGALYCWGENGWGATGDRGSRRTDVPLQLSDRGYREVSVGGYFSCAIRDTEEVTGSVECWGANDWGQLGRGDVNGDVDGKGSIERKPVKNLTNAKHIAAGAKHACALIEPSGSKALELWCWGDYDDRLQTEDRLLASRVPKMVTASSASFEAFGYGYVVSMRDTSGHWWALNSYGRDNDTIPLKQFTTEVPSPRYYLDLGTYECFLESGNRPGLQCKGNNEFGQLGRGDSDVATSEYAPVSFPQAGWLMFSADTSMVCGVSTIDGATEGKAWCWGLSNTGSAGVIPTPENAFLRTPHQVGSLEDWTAVEAGTFLSCGMRREGDASGGRVYCWGGYYARGPDGGFDVTPKQVCLRSAAGDE
jgi:hypothetical protein